jgi:hypothetical protein
MSNFCPDQGRPSEICFAFHGAGTRVCGEQAGHPFSVLETFEKCSILFKIKAWEKNNRRHIVDIPRIIF